MEQFTIVTRQIAVWIGQWLALCSQNWLLTILMFLMVLSLIVSVILNIRGGN